MPAVILRVNNAISSRQRNLCLFWIRVQTCWPNQSLWPFLSWPTWAEKLSNSIAGKYATQETFGVSMANAGYFKVAYALAPQTHRPSESNKTMAELDITQGTKTKSKN